MRAVTSHGMTLFTFTPLRVRGDADDDNSMLLVLVSLPALPTPTTCAQAVATLNADEALAKEFAAYNKTDCMSYDFDPKNRLPAGRPRGHPSKSSSSSVAEGEGGDVQQSGVPGLAGGRGEGSTARHVADLVGAGRGVAPRLSGQPPLLPRLAV